MISKFKIESDFVPSGDQPKAIKALADNIKNGKCFQTLLGATGTGKSLDYNEPVILKNEKNEIIKTRIGDFVEESLTKPHTLNETQYQRITGYKILSFNNVDYNIQEKKIKEISKHKEDFLYEITLDDSSNIRVTKDHNCFKFDNCEFELCPTNELKIGDYLPVSNNILKFQHSPNKFLNLLDHNQSFKVNVKSLIEKNRGSLDIIKDVLKNEHYAYNWKLEQILKETKERGITIKNLKILLNKLNLKLDNVYPEIKIITKGDDLLHPLIPIDDNFLIFSGLYISEGHCTDRYILISNSDKNLQDRCKEFFDNFNLNYNQRNQ